MHANSNGTVKVVENSFLGCWEINVDPSFAYQEANPGTRFDLVFHPTDTKDEALEEAKEFADHHGMVVIH